MKPKTVLEHTIFNLKDKLKPLSQKQIDWGFNNCFNPIGTINKQTINCLECGHQWKEQSGIILLIKIEQNCQCPNCYQVIKVQQTAKRKLESSAYYSIITATKNFQVVRYLILKKHYQIKNSPTLFSSEVMQHWINTKGKITYLSKPCIQHPYYYDHWKTNSDLQIAKPNSYRAKSRLDTKPSKIYPVKKVLSIIRRNGFKSTFYNCQPTKFFSRLLSKPIFETLIKCNRMDFAKSLPFDTIEKLWPQVKIAIKNNYFPTNYISWSDLIELLKQFNKDIHSAKYICPLDLAHEHQKLINKRRKILQNQQLQEQLKLIYKSNQSFIPQKKKYFSIHFQNSNIKVIVLKNVKEFFAESQKLNHCLFINKYYQKKNSLILSARTMENQPIETIEFSLTDFEIIQSRGLNNLPTESHNEIVELVNQNIPIIKRIHFNKQPA